MVTEIAKSLKISGIGRHNCCAGQVHSHPRNPREVYESVCINTFVAICKLDKAADKVRGAHPISKFDSQFLQQSACHDGGRVECPVKLVMDA